MTTPRRWPRFAEASRQEALVASEDALAFLRQARSQIHRDPREAELAMADAMSLIERIARLMIVAKIGRPCDEDTKTVGA